MMTNVYHSEITQLLLRCGRSGLRVADISKYVYNLHAELFNDDLTFDALHQTLRCYLWRQSHLRRSPFRRVRYGVYAIKDDMALQLDFCFDKPVGEEPEPIIFEPLAEKPKTFPDNPSQLLLFPDFF